MIRSLHRRFLWNALTVAAVFLFIVMAIALALLVSVVDDQLCGALNRTLQFGQPDSALVGARTRLPSYLAVVHQTVPDPEATQLFEGDTVEFLRGDRSDWTEEEIRTMVGEMLDGPDCVRIIPSETLCYLVDRTGGMIRIAAIDYEGYSTLLNHIFLGSALLYVLIFGALFLLFKLAEIRLLRPAERAWANQERFVEDASHEIKTPLAVILSNAELGASDEPGETKRRFSMILSEAQRMKLLITRMLETARIENNAAKHQNDTVFSLSDAVTECALVYEEPLYERGITLTSEVEPDLFIRADETLLKQVLRALLENAGKYTPRGKNVFVRLKRRYTKAELTVRNEGAGLDRYARENIFERFYRVDEARTAEPGSYGLGLSIAKNLIESMRGRIRCESDGSSFTAFAVTLPLRRKK